jgi:hypothetical protein
MAKGQYSPVMPYTGSIPILVNNPMSIPARGPSKAAPMAVKIESRKSGDFIRILLNQLNSRFNDEQASTAPLMRQTLPLRDDR